MKKIKISYLISSLLLFISIFFTFLVKTMDVAPVGVNNSEIGFSTLNKFMFDTIGTNDAWYTITDILGLIALLGAATYAVIGVLQLIKRKSLFKVDKEIVLLGVFFFITIIVYVLFEKLAINYRPVLVEGILEASYPSSHTLLIICLCGSIVIVNKCLFKQDIFKYINIFLIGILCITVVGRLLSGVHWFTDIIGGILIASTLLMTFYSTVSLFNYNEKK